MKREFHQIEAVAEALLWIGHSWLGLNQPEKAFNYYEKSLKIRRELGQENFIMGVFAGMARAALAKDDLDSASKYVFNILSYLDGGGSLDGTWEPLRILFTCCQVLAAIQDSRADEVIEITYLDLQNRAETILDEDSRRMFLENVPWNREIIAAHDAMISQNEAL